MATNQKLTLLQYDQHIEMIFNLKRDLSLFVYVLIIMEVPISEIGFDRFKMSPKIKLI